MIINMPPDSSIFDSQVSVLVNPVNCKGVADAGLAAEFKRRYPDNFMSYAFNHQLGVLKPGYVHIVWTDNGKWIDRIPVD
jgi:hypothetical protein